MYQTLDDLERNQNNIETPNKRKKRLKWSLIFLWILLSLGWARAWLTRAWIILNRFDIEILYPNIEYDMGYFLDKDLEKQSEEGRIYEDFKDTDISWTMEDFSPWENNDLLQLLIEPAHLEKVPVAAAKPIIYLYPTTETKTNVKLWKPKNLSHTYPKYNWEKWRNIIAQPTGDLEDMDTWRKLYALYREWKSDNETNFDEWFVVKWKDIIPFLEEKLAILWLNEREAEEFIVYWLPQMENNEYNLIRFETIEEQDENMPLNITPKPDTVIRVMMDWKAINEPIDILEQELVTPERNWFTVVEWWGSLRK